MEKKHENYRLDKNENFLHYALSKTKCSVVIRSSNKSTNLVKTIKQIRCLNMLLTGTLLQIPACVNFELYR